MSSEVVAAFITGAFGIVILALTIWNDRAMRRRQAQFEARQEDATRERDELVSEVKQKTDVLTALMQARVAAQRAFLDSLDEYARECREQNRLNASSAASREERRESDQRYRTRLAELKGARSGLSLCFTERTLEAADKAVAAAEGLSPGLGDGAYMQAKERIIAAARRDLGDYPWESAID